MGMARSSSRLIRELGVRFRPAAIQRNAAETEAVQHEANHHQGLARTHSELQRPTRIRPSGQRAKNQVVVGEPYGAMDRHTSGHGWKSHTGNDPMNKSIACETR